MTFSDPKVAELVNAKFVSAWHNRSPGFHNDDYGAEKEIFDHANEAYPTQNICTFVLAPDGRVLHYVAGYLAPELFLDFLATALKLRDAGFDERMQLRPDGAAQLARVHAERATHFKGTKHLPEVASRTYRGVTHAHAQRCEWNQREAIKYFQRLHDHQGKVAVLPTLADVRYAYLYGNTFTEEGAGASKIAHDNTIPRG